MLAQNTGHINNTYNTAFWTLILKGGLEAREAEQKLSVRMTPNAEQPSSLVKRVLTLSNSGYCGVR
jgi:tRNA(His) 5'-end guanylyltransferase